MEEPEFNLCCQFIGIVKHPNLDADILNFFTSKITLSNPTAFERYGIFRLISKLLLFRVDCRKSKLSQCKEAAETPTKSIVGTCKSMI